MSMVSKFLGGIPVLGSLTGAAGGQSGTGIGGPAAAPIQPGATVQSVQQAQAGTNNALAGQNALLNALQNQRGLQFQNAATSQDLAFAQQLGANNGAVNQANAYNATNQLQGQLAAQQGVSNATGAINQQRALNAQTSAANGVGAQAAALGGQGSFNQQLIGANGVGAQTGALAGQNAFNQQLAGANGLGTQQSAVQGLQGVAAQQRALEAQQQGVAGQYQNIASGVGPNPAKAMLNQQTGQNVSQQAALMAGQRGAGANAGLIARQAAQQGAATQQQAVGQAATMQANQQIAGLQGLSAQQAAMGNTAQQQAATQQAIGGLGTTQLGAQQAGISQAAQQGAQLAAQQQAGLSQQAQQGAQLSAEQQAGISQQAAQASNQIQQQQAQQNAMAQQAAAQVGAQQAAFNAAAGQSNTLAGQQIGQAGSATQAALANSAQQQQALANYNSSLVGGQNSINTANAAMANTVLQGQQSMTGGMLSGLSVGIGALAGGAGAAAPAAAIAAGAEGGVVHKMAAGGAMPGPDNEPTAFGKFVNGWKQSTDPSQNDDGSAQLLGMGGNKQLSKGASDFTKSFFGSSSASGPGSGAIDANAPVAGQGASNLSPGIGSDIMVGAGGGLAQTGGNVRAGAPSQKAVKSGNSYDNDKVPAMLSEGEIVLPREVTMGKDPVRSSADFVRKVLAKRRASA